MIYETDDEAGTVTVIDNDPRPRQTSNMAPTPEVLVWRRVDVSLTIQTVLSDVLPAELRPAQPCLPGGLALFSAHRTGRLKIAPTDGDARSHGDLARQMA